MLDHFRNVCYSSSQVILTIHLLINLVSQCAIVVGLLIIIKHWEHFVRVLLSELRQRMLFSVLIWLLLLLMNFCVRKLLITSFLFWKTFQNGWLIGNYPIKTVICEKKIHWDNLAINSRIQRSFVKNHAITVTITDRGLLLPYLDFI